MTVGWIIIIIAAGISDISLKYWRCRLINITFMKVAPYIISEATQQDKKSDSYEKATDPRGENLFCLKFEKQVPGNARHKN